MKAPTESDLVKQCLDWLAYRGFLAWRNANAGIRRRDKSGREFWAFRGLAGASDILGVVCRCAGLRTIGQFLAVEAKLPGGRLTAAQGAFLDVIRQHGGLAFVVRSLADLEEAFRQEGLI